MTVIYYFIKTLIFKIQKRVTLIISHDIMGKTGRSRTFKIPWARMVFAKIGKKKTFKFFKSENKLFMKEKTLFMINFLFAN